MAARALPLLLVLALGCQGQTVGEGSSSGGAAGSGNATSGGASSGGTSSGGSAGGVSGPGAHGSLPGGYCCTADSECRFRNCRDFGGVKLCSDSCLQDSACSAAPNMKCDTTAEDCVPTGAPSCIPAELWTSGTTPIGGCCIATGDGSAGEECQGNLCQAFGALSNPFICTHACDAPKDCPPKYECNAFTKSCWPLATTYDCQ